MYFSIGARALLTHLLTQTLSHHPKYIGGGACFPPNYTNVIFPRFLAICSVRLSMYTGAVSQFDGCSLARTRVASCGDEARALPSVCSVQSLERLASVEALLLPLFNIAPVVNIVIF